MKQYLRNNIKNRNKGSSNKTRLFFFKEKKEKEKEKKYPSHYSNIQIYLKDQSIDLGMFGCAISLINQFPQ